MEILALLSYSPRRDCDSSLYAKHCGASSDVQNHPCIYCSFASLKLSDLVGSPFSSEVALA